MSDTEVRPKSGAQIGVPAPTVRHSDGEGASGGPQSHRRRAALSTIIRGGLAAMVATLTRPSTTHAHQDEPRTVRLTPFAEPVAAAPVPDMDRAEALLLELAGILPHLSERDVSNVNHVLDQVFRATEGGPDRVAARLADDPLEVGPGNRVHDRIDREQAAERRAAITHAEVVARYATAYHAGGTNAGIEVRAELARTYGEGLGAAIAGAAFDLYLHELKHTGCQWPACDDD